MEKEYNKYLWSPKQPRVYGISPLTISGTPMPEEDVATLLKVEKVVKVEDLKSKSAKLHYFRQSRLF